MLKVCSGLPPCLSSLLVCCVSEALIKSQSKGQTPPAGADIAWPSWPGAAEIKACGRPSAATDQEPQQSSTMEGNEKKTRLNAVFLPQFFFFFAFSPYFLLLFKRLLFFSFFLPAHSDTAVSTSVGCTHTRTRADTHAGKITAFSARGTERRHDGTERQKRNNSRTNTSLFCCSASVLFAFKSLMSLHLSPHPKFPCRAIFFGHIQCNDQTHKQVRLYSHFR